MEQGDMNPSFLDPTSLRRGIAGAVLLPGEAAFDRARRVWNAMVDRQPAIIARCSSPSDVAAAVRFGRTRGLEIGVRGGGHSVLGLAVPEGGLMIDLSPMAAVAVDPQRRRARVQGGALLGALDRAAQSFGLATTAGNVSHTGVGGLTLGGGMGWLARQFGLACDNVVSFELVTADGEVVRASESENADLYWGLRGGGGNFGVVTEFEFRLHRVDGAALVVDLVHTWSDAPAAMRRWRDLVADAPRQATLTAAAGAGRRWPFVPPRLRDDSLVSIGFVWVGNPDEGRRLLPALRGSRKPVAERIEEHSYVQLQCGDDDREGSHLRRYWRGHYLRRLDEAAIEAFVSRGIQPGAGEGDPMFLPGGRLQTYGGEIGALGDDETAFGHRDALVEFVAGASWARPAEDERRMSAARRYGAAMAPFASGVYVNDLGDEGEAGVRRAYGAAKMGRLAALKARYDPDNVFHLNHNIRPPLTGGARASMPVFCRGHVRRPRRRAVVGALQCRPAELQ
jgi:FAD/FMN-containing dehydrogenase